MRVLYLTDDRSQYRQGYYYVDWIEAFQQAHDVWLWGPEHAEAPSQGDLRNFDLIVIGHGGFDVFMQYGFRFRQWPWKYASAAPFYGFDLRGVDCPKVLLSRNDYKNFHLKAVFVRRFRIDLLVTHTKRSLGAFGRWRVPATWVPFGVNPEIFTDRGIERDIDLGFRGNLNSEWNGGLRQGLLDAVQRDCAGRRLDIVTSNSAEAFLFGEKYVAWTNRCHLCPNTVSAWDTVGPKWWEQLACGTVPVAPVDPYEGLLEPDVHYLAVDPDLRNVGERVDEYFNDSALRARLREGAAAMTAQADMRERLAWLWRELSDRGLVAAEVGAKDGSCG